MCTCKPGKRHLQRALMERIRVINELHRAMVWYNVAWYGAVWYGTVGLDNVLYGIMHGTGFV